MEAKRRLYITTVLILGHGSRDPISNAEFEELVGAYRRRHPELTVVHGFTELAQPSFQETLETNAAAGHDVAVIPLSLFTAGHIKNDLPLVFAQLKVRYPKLRFLASEALGVHPQMVALAQKRLKEISPQGVGAKAALLIVGRGSSDPDANGDFFKMSRLIAEGTPFMTVASSFIGITRPSVEESLEQLARTRPDELWVAPYFLISGRLLTRLAEQLKGFADRYPWIKTQMAPHLGQDEALFQLMDERLDQALSGRKVLPCDTCHYRTAIGHVAHKVGGLEALLYSVRHTVTHQQAAPHIHAHRALKKHVLVCANADCADKGSLSVIAALRRGLKDVGKQREIRVTKTGCMGRCGEGPTLAVYPDGVWYRAVHEEDAQELIQEHLLKDKLVSRLVDNIMQ